MAYHSAESLLKALKTDAEIYLFCLSFALIGIFFFVSYFFIKRQLKHFLGISILAFSSALNLVRLAPTHSLFLGSFEIFGVHLGTLALYMMPVGILAFTEEMVNQAHWHKRVLRVLWKFFLGHALLMGFLDLMGVCEIGASNSLFTVVFLISLTFIPFTKGTGGQQTVFESRLRKWSFAAVNLTGFIHGIIMLVSKGKGPPIFQYGIFLVMIFFMLSLVHRFKIAHTLLEKRSNELKEKNSALNQALSEVDELNKSLEMRVKRETEQLMLANKELNASNSHLQITMGKLMEAQSQLVQSEKLSALGSLVAGITHEINTPIATIQSNLQLEETLYTRINTSQPETIEAYLEYIPSLRENSLEATKRVSHIIHDMRIFTQLDGGGFKQANINDGIESTLTLLNYKFLEKKIKVRRSMGEIPDILCMPRQINQLILILLENAIEAISHNGEIGISSRLEGRTILLSISCTGREIYSDSLPRVLKPDLYRQGFDEGNSLGLAIASRIVEQHRGSIVVESMKGQGNNFRIEIPVVTAHSLGPGGVILGEMF